MELSAVVLNVDGSGRAPPFYKAAEWIGAIFFFDPGVAAWPQRRKTVVAIIHVLA
jgi:hypothetical protein